MKQLALTLAVMAAMAPTLSHAEAGDWVLRARAINVNPDENSHLGTTAIRQRFIDMNDEPWRIDSGADITLDDDWNAEIDLSYYFTKNLAIELAITPMSTSLDTGVRGSGIADYDNAGKESLKFRTSTLMAQWHFMPDQTFDPYIGAGLNYTRFSSKLGRSGGDERVSDRNTFGAVFGGGIDVNLQDGWLINADVKYAFVNTNIETRATNGWFKVDDLDVNPWIVGIGVGLVC